jgi:hypothetical protein
MITNTQRILYEDGYYPAYQQRTDKKIYNQGGLYTIENIEEVKTNRVWKVELETGIVTYFSDCSVYTDIFNPKHISDIQQGDNLIVVYPYFRFSSKTTFARTVLKAFLYNEDVDKVCKTYKIKSLNNFKLLANKYDFISDFLCSIVRTFFKDFRYDWIIVKNTFNYELLQEIMLAFQMFGIHTKIKKERGKWVLFISTKHFMKNIGGPLGYSTCTHFVENIKEIKQDTQAFKITTAVPNQLVVNSVMIKGD